MKRYRIIKNSSQIFRIQSKETWFDYWGYEYERGKREGLEGFYEWAIELNTIEAARSKIEELKNKDRQLLQESKWVVVE